MQVGLPGSFGAESRDTAQNTVRRTGSTLQSLLKKQRGLMAQNPCHDTPNVRVQEATCRSIGVAISYSSCEGQKNIDTHCLDTGGGGKEELSVGCIRSLLVPLNGPRALAISAPQRRSMSAQVRTILYWQCGFPVVK